MSVELPAPGRMEDRVVVITGASSGIGRAAARELALLGATIAVVGRNPERTRAVAAEVSGTAYLVDYADLQSVRDLAERLLADLPRIHVLANNAGAIGPRATTRDGFDQTFQQNHLSPFLLTNLLLPRLVDTARDAPPGSVRIIQTSSAGNLFGRVRIDDLDNRHVGPWLGGFTAYGTSKLENILFTRELARRHQGDGISAYAFHPGYVASGFGGDGPVSSLMKRAAVSPEEGAAPLVRLASTARVPAPSGNYFDRLTAPGRTRRQANDAGLAAALWAESERRSGLAG
ncbi:SDR family NAD(P)-dependent oxidoreductase [uncultured Amnibacterium sp.]|uniref:SDR family NAD(P)-dependent oxidoreductase n=1 Tax=uncultured Amnibacterium sp. TaxID=1631851 RepID=UPI0035C9AD38